MKRHKNDTSHRKVQAIVIEHEDSTGLSRGDSCLLLRRDQMLKPGDATGLSRGVFTFAATRGIKKLKSGCHGLVAVELHVCCYLAGNVNLPGARPWHPVSQFKTISVATSVRDSTGQARGILDFSCAKPSKMIRRCKFSRFSATNESGGNKLTQRWR